MSVLCCICIYHCVACFHLSSCLETRIATKLCLIYIAAFLLLVSGQLCVLALDRIYEHTMVFQPKSMCDLKW